MKGLSADHGKGSGSALKGEAFFEGGRWPSVREGIVLLTAGRPLLLQSKLRIQYELFLSMLSLK